MDARELRIGNLVYAGIDENELPLPCAVKEIGEGYIKWGSRGGSTTYINFVDPIPITLGMLQAAGFKKKYSNEHWSHWVLENNWHISEWLVDQKVAGFEEKGVCYWGEEYVPIKYLHQLQNLFFCLCDKELEINL